MVNVHPDTSEHQGPITAAFTRRFLMFRALSEYGRQDYKAPANQSGSIAQRAAGKLDNFGEYVIPGFVSNATLLAGLDALKMPRDCAVMVDWETWGGALGGDHSANNNDLANKLRARQGGRADLVWGYSNRGDLTGWRIRPAWLGFIIAGYSANDPRDEGIGNVIGWQYTNGTENHTAYPSSTPPFGACDHNVMFINYPKPGKADWFDMATPADLRTQIDAALKAHDAATKQIVASQLSYHLPRIIAALRWGKGNAAYNATNAGALIDGKGLDGEIQASQAANVDAAAIVDEFVRRLTNG